jgi:hypothetical protein
MKLNPFSVGGRDKKGKRTVTFLSVGTVWVKGEKKSARFQMHNQRISFVFLFSSRQRRISSFLKKKAYTHYQDPANSFISPPLPIRVVFSQFRRQFEISLPFIMRGSREKSGKTSRNERRRRLEWQPRLSGCYKQGSTQRPYNSKT